VEEKRFSSIGAQPEPQQKPDAEMQKIERDKSAEPKLKEATTLKDEKKEKEIQLVGLQGAMFYLK